MATMNELVVWLRAQLDEDERVARAAVEPDEMHPYGDRQLPRLTVDQWPGMVHNYLGGTWGEHSARHDPARVLRDVAAKRAIVDWAERNPRACDDVHPETASWHPAGHGPHVILRQLASAYTDRPGYREEWKP